jgi:hypothetical protein
VRHWHHCQSTCMFTNRSIPSAVEQMGKQRLRKSPRRTRTEDVCIEGGLHPLKVQPILQIPAGVSGSPAHFVVGLPVHCIACSECSKELQDLNRPLLSFILCLHPHRLLFTITGCSPSQAVRHHMLCAITCCVPSHAERHHICACAITH